MTESEWTVDARCHGSDERVCDRSAGLLARMIEGGIKGFLLGGVNREERERQNQLAARFPGRV